MKTASLLIATLAAITTAWAGAGLAAGGGVRTVHYEGQLLNNPQSKVTLSVQRKHGRPKLATFTARRFRLLCDDNTTEVYPSVLFHGRFGRNGKFEDDDWEYSQFGGTSFFEVEGRLLPGGKAKGTLLVIRNPPGLEEPGCSSYADRGPWEAKARRRP